MFHFIIHKIILGSLKRVRASATFVSKLTSTVRRKVRCEDRRGTDWSGGTCRVLYTPLCMDYSL